MVVLWGSVYKTVNITNLLHAASCSVLEQASLLASVAIGLTINPLTKHYVSRHCKIKSKLYLSLIFPEVIRCVAIILQIFDPEPSLLLLIACLIFSIQSMSFRALVHVNKKQYIIAVVLALLSRVFVKYFFYSTSDIGKLGCLCDDVGYPLSSSQQYIVNFLKL